MTDNAATTLAVISTILVVAPLVSIFLYLIFKGASSLNLAFFTQAPKPVGEVGGGMANSILGSGNSVGCRQLNWRTDWNIGRDLSGGVWAWRKTGEHSSLYGRRVERRSLNRDGHLHLLAHRHTAETLLGSLRRRRSWPS